MDETSQFYDDLASYYHLIFEDWDASMARQGDAIASLIRAELNLSQAQTARVLDVACGIGTQTLPLAARGFQMVARDLSRAAVIRLQREAVARHFVVDAGVADMRQVHSSVLGAFDVVIAFDNSVAHLLNDDDLRTAFQEFLAVLRPGGAFMCSVRDYDKFQRGEPATIDHGTREERGQIYSLAQQWSWNDPMHYQSTLTVDRETPNSPARVVSTVSRFYAISTGRLLELMRESGFRECRRIDEAIYQPVLLGRKVA
jgi:SAM-dependent methyltransferase